MNNATTIVNPQLNYNSIFILIKPHTHTHRERERERERCSDRNGHCRSHSLCHMGFTHLWATIRGAFVTLHTAKAVENDDHRNPPKPDVSISPRNNDALPELHETIYRPQPS